MVQGAHSYKGYIGVGVHATSIDSLRAAKVPRTAFSPFHDLEVTHAHGEERDPTSRRADPESVALGNYDLRLRGTLEGGTEGIVPHLARSLLGGQPATTTVGTTGKQHLFEVADTIPINGGRMSFEVREGTSAESEIGNMVCGMLEFNITQAGYARWGFEALGSSPEYLAGPTVPSLPSVSSILAQRQTTFTFNGDATAKVVRGLSWRLSRDLVEDDYDVTSRQRRDTSYGGMEASFSAELTYINKQARREFWGGAGVSVPGDESTYYPVNIKTERTDVIAGGTAKHTAELDLPKAFIRQVPHSMRGREVIRERVEGFAVYDPTGGVARAQRLKLINTVAAY